MFIEDTPAAPDTNMDAGAATEDLADFEDKFFNRLPVDEKSPEGAVEDSEPEDGQNEEPKETPDDETPLEETPPKPKKTANERIQELVKDRRAAEETARAEREAREALEARLAALEKDQSQVKTPEVKAPVEPDPDALNDSGEPLYPLGELDPKFIAAVVRYNFAVERHETELANAKAKAEAEEAAKAETKRQEYEAELAAATKAWNDKLSETETTLPDLREKLATLDDTFQSVPSDLAEYLAKTIMSMEQGPEVLYYLADNLDEAVDIVSAGPVAATIALAKLEASLERPRNVKTATKTAAPPPTTRGTRGAKVVSADTDDLADFERIFYNR